MVSGGSEITYSGIGEYLKNLSLLLLSPLRIARLRCGRLYHPSCINIGPVGKSLADVVQTLYNSWVRQCLHQGMMIFRG